MATFTTPEMDKGFKLIVDGEDAKEIFIDFSTRNGKVVRERLSRKIWQKHELPMYRGTIVEEVPFQLRLSQILLDFHAYKITVVYSFVSTV